MYALAILTYRVPLDAVEAATDAHRAYLRQLKADGTLVASGPFVPRTGGALLLRVPDDAAAAAAVLDAVRDNDPFWQQGIANYQLLAWNPGIGRDGLDAI
ncbi:MAG: YciI family protein [Gemmatimonadaceae bacterium]